MKFEMELQAVNHLFIKWSDINVYIHPRKPRQVSLLSALLGQSSFCSFRPVLFLLFHQTH